MTSNKRKYSDISICVPLINSIDINRVTKKKRQTTIIDDLISQHKLLADRLTNLEQQCINYKNYIQNLESDFKKFKDTLKTDLQAIHAKHEIFLNENIELKLQLTCLNKPEDSREDYSFYS